MNSNTGYTLADGRDLSSVFMGINNGASLANANVFQSRQKFAKDIDLSGSFFYNMPNTTISGTNYPIGYTIDISSGIVSGTDLSSTSYLTYFKIYSGVWLTTVRFVSSGTGTYSSNSRLRIELVDPNLVYSPPSPLLRIPIEASMHIGLTCVIVSNKDYNTYATTAVATISGISYVVYIELLKIA